MRSAPVVPTDFGVGILPAPTAKAGLNCGAPEHMSAPLCPVLMAHLLPRSEMCTSAGWPRLRRGREHAERTQVGPGAGPVSAIKWGMRAAGCAQACVVYLARGYLLREGSEEVSLRASGAPALGGAPQLQPAR